MPTASARRSRTARPYWNSISFIEPAPLRAGRADNGIVRSVGARRGVALRDLVDGEQSSRQNHVAELQRAGQRHQCIEPESESFVFHEVKRGQHPYIDV